MSDEVVAGGGMFWRFDGPRPERYFPSIEPTDLQTALFTADEVIDGAVVAVAHPETPVVFLFGTSSLFASVESFLGSESFVVRYARSEEAAEIRDRLVRSGYVDFTGALRRG